MMAWIAPLRHWFGPDAPMERRAIDDEVSEHLRAAVNEDARVKADSVRSYESRVQSMIDELFLKMGEGHARHNP